jgi:hypothetical protein
VSHSGAGKIKGFHLAPSLPAIDLLHRRNITQASACGICGVEDSWGHSLVECMMARCVWTLADEDMVEHMCQVKEPHARLWLFTMIDTLSHVQLTHMCVTLWAI